MKKTTFEECLPGYETPLVEIVNCYLDSTICGSSKQQIDDLDEEDI